MKWLDDTLNGTPNQLWTARRTIYDKKVNCHIRAQQMDPEALENYYMYYELCRAPITRSVQWTLTKQSDT